MKQLLFLLLFPCLCVAQYTGNAGQKITLGEQTSADGLVYRGLAADTTRKPSVDTMAYILLDTNTNIIWQYKKATSNAWLKVNLTRADTTLFNYVNTYGTQTVNGAKTLTEITTIKSINNGDGGQLTANILTKNNWSGFGVNWTTSDTSLFTHVTGSVDTLKNTTPAIVNNFYQITYTVTNRTAGTFVILFGGYTSGNLSATGAVGPRANSIQNLSIVPTSNFDGSINILIQVINNGSAILQFQNSSSVVTNEIRAHLLTNNTSLGLGTLRRITTGFGNTALGNNALANNTSGNENIAIGSALPFNTIGGRNIAIGNNSLLNNTFGQANLSFGYEALYSNTLGNFNYAFGFRSLYNNLTGINNIGFGPLSLSDLTTGSENIGIGVSAGRNLTTGSNNTIIGSNVNFPSTSASNQLNIKNIIFATNASGFETTIAGNVGIAVNTPTARLHLVAGTATASTAPLKFTSGVNLTSPLGGEMEFNGTNLFFSPSTTRHTVNHGLTGSATLNFPSTTTLLSADLTITVTGAADGDVVSLGVPNAAVNANTSYSAWVSAANTVTVRFNNYSSGTVDPASASFKVFVTK